MNKSIVAVVAVVAMAAVALPSEAAANTTYYYMPTTGYQYQPVTWNTSTIGGTKMTEAQMIAYLQQLILQLQAQLASKGNTGYYPYGGSSYGYGYVIGEPRGSGSSRGGDDEPEVETESAKKIEDDRATLRGSVDMMDFEDGEVFFVFGTDEDAIEDVEDDFDSYRDVDEDGDDLMKERVDSSLDGDADYEMTVTGLDEDTDYYFQICVGYEDEDGDDVLKCGGVDDFTTDDN